MNRQQVFAARSILDSQQLASPLRMWMFSFWLHHNYDVACLTDRLEAIEDRLAAVEAILCQTSSL